MGQSGPGAGDGGVGDDGDVFELMVVRCDGNGGDGGVMVMWI